MKHDDFILRYSEAPQAFCWFIGAGTSRSAGLPTATDIIWTMKRRYYCAHENQEVTLNDIQNSAVRGKIDAFMISRGFPPENAPDEYSLYFELIFGDDKERQRAYIRKVLSEDKVSLTVGHRVLGALVGTRMIRTLFTTNFDSVVEKAVAETTDSSLSAFHIEGSRAANAALNNEEYPIYCKLHGDFRFDSLKNLKPDLAVQDKERGKCLINACNRFGLVVVGYSGRDESVMKLLHDALETPNPFPHGLYWTGLKNSASLGSVEKLLAAATARGVTAEFVEIETFDSLMARIWRQLPDKDAQIDRKVRKTARRTVSIPMPDAG